jgi:hypothetical protein
LDHGSSTGWIEGEGTPPPRFAFLAKSFAFNGLKFSSGLFGEWHLDCLTQG